ncbi:MAG: hypothetical protein MJ010_02395 [Paludibacteraceae bacterium]|nr:hypothetical protein [Paludibacteraceae bacterium]
MNKEYVVKYVSLILLAIVTAICAFFIIYNAQWQIGDDAFVIKGIGFGDYFSPNVAIRPSEGRFYPTSYLGYNLLAFICQGNITPTAVYIYHACFFLMMVVSAMIFFIMIQNSKKSIYLYPIAVLAVFVIIARRYALFANCFSTGWFGSGLSFVMLICLYQFIQTKKSVYAIIYFLYTVYSTYSTEKAFIFPLVLGLLGLILLRKQNTKKEKIFYWALIADALIFLIIYFFCVFLKTENSYDGAHGSGVGFWENVGYIIYAQKIFWVAIPLMFFRLWEIFKNHKECTIFDVLLLCAAAQVCGNFILKLNWVSYYTGSAIMCLCCIVYFFNEYFNPKWTCLLIALLACFYCRKIPTDIININNDRTDAKAFVDAVVKKAQNGNSIYFFNPETQKSDFDVTQRLWLYDALQIYIAYEFSNKQWKAVEKKSYDGSTGIWITFDQNDRLSDMGNKVIVENTTKFAYNNMRKIGAFIKE